MAIDGKTLLAAVHAYSAASGSHADGIRAAILAYEAAKPVPASGGVEAVTEIEMVEKTTAALVIMARSNIPPDIQELLVYGNPDRSIPPGILKRALAEADGRQVAHGLAALASSTPAKAEAGTGEVVRDATSIAERLRASSDPVGEIVLFGEGLKEVSWHKGRMPLPGTKLYALPAEAEAASSPATMEGVRVKPLEWLSHAWGSEADGGRYRIEDNGTNWTDDRYWLFVNVGLLSNHRSTHSTLAEAKAAAQAHYEARILPALAPAPAETSTSGSDFARRWRQDHPDGTIDELLAALDAALSPEAKERSNG